MSDPVQPPPPKPKPGSLRDRIAAFENPASASSSLPKPPSIRPKPGNVSWKPVPPLPNSTVTASVTLEPEERNQGGMSATDAKESIGRGGSLKERMAALQGKGAFGGGPSPSPPAVGPKPAKRPPLVSPAPVEESEEKEKGLAEPKLDEKQGNEQRTEEEAGLGTVATVTDGGATSEEAKAEPADEERDEEAKERERRATIAARMARLGGARVGISPPVFGKKPVTQDKPKAVPAQEEEPKETMPPVAVEAGVQPVSQDSLTPSEAPASLAEETVSSPEVKDISPIVTDEGASSKDTVGDLPQSPLSPSTSPSESRPNLDSSRFQSSIASSLSPPTSMPIPAAPRRAGPPRKRSARNIKTEAKKHDQTSPEVLSTPSAELVSSQVDDVSTTAEEDHAQKEPDSAPEPETIEAQVDTPPAHQPVTISKDPEILAASPSPVHAVKEAELVDEAPESPDVVREQPMELLPNIHGRDALPSPEPSPLVNNTIPDVFIPAPERAARAVESEELSETTGFYKESSQQHGDHDPELVVNDKDPADATVTSRVYDARDTTDIVQSPVIESGTHMALPPGPAGLESPEPEVEVVIHGSKQLHGAAVEAETEDDEAARRKRIAERIAKMGARNPFAAGSFGAGAPPRKVSGDESQETLSLPPLEEFSTVENDNEDNVPEQETIAETAVGSEGHMAEDLGPHASGVAQEQGDDVPPIKESLEKHEAIELEHTTKSQLLSGSGLQEHPEPTPLVEATQSAEDDMAPPRITRAIPPPPQPISPQRPALPWALATSKSSHQKRLIPSPPEESPSAVRNPSTSLDEEEGDPYLSPGHMDTPPPARDQISIPSPESEQPGEAGNVSPLSSPASRKSLPPPAGPPSIAGSSKFRSPTSPVASRRSIPPPPRTIPVPPGEDDRAEGEPLASPTSSRHVASPHARLSPVTPSDAPGFPKAVSAVPPPSVRRSIPPPPPRRASLQPAEGHISHPPNHAPFHPTEEAVGVISHSRTTASPAHAAEPIISRDSVDEQEVLADSDTDPIDPSFYSPPRSPASSPPPRPQHQHSFTFKTAESSIDTADVDVEQARRRTIAERMAKLGGLKFGAPPVLPKPLVSTPEQLPRADATEVAVAQQGDAEAVTPKDEPEETLEPDSEESERLRRQTIAVRLAGMGGMRFGMLPQTSTPPAHPRTRSDDSARTVDHSSSPPQRAQPPPPPPESEGELQSEARSVSDEGVNVEAASETSIEEVNPEDAEEDLEEIPPPVPSRPIRSSYVPVQVAPPLPGGRRPPVPASSLPTRPPIPKVEPRHSNASGSSHRESGFSATPLPGDFVMVDDPTPMEEPPPPPPPRVRPPRAVPPPAPPVPPSAPSSVLSSKDKDTTNSQWELPDIPSGSFDVNVGGTGLMGASISSEDSTLYPPTLSAQSHRRPAEPTPSAPATHAEVQLSADELLQIWGTVGTAVHGAAATLFDRSKKRLVGDGTSRGFVMAALAQVPQASKASYGQLIYSQNGQTVLRRSSNIMPGDIIQLTEAKLKGHKGLQSYHQSAGTVQDPAVGIVSEFDGKKSKVRVYQANQHVGAQTIETASYRLDDLKSGNVQVFRVLSA